MVLTKQYDRHVPEKVFGIIGSGNATNLALAISTTNSSVQQINDTESYTEEDENIQEPSLSI